MGSFYAPTFITDCLQILYKFCKNWISVPNVGLVYQLTLSLRCKYCKIHSRSNFQDAINSIRRSAAERLQANDVSLLWRHSSESVRGRSNMLIEGHFWRFLGNLNPKMLSAIEWTPKRHFLTSQRVFWTMVREIPCTGYFSRRVRGKIKIKKRGLIFHVFHQALPYGRLTQILGYVFVSWT